MIQTSQDTPSEIVASEKVESKMSSSEEVMRKDIRVESKMGSPKKFMKKETKIVIEQQLKTRKLALEAKRLQKVTSELRTPQKEISCDSIVVPVMSDSAFQGNAIEQELMKLKKCANSFAKAKPMKSEATSVYDMSNGEREMDLIHKQIMRRLKAIEQLKSSEMSSSMSECAKDKLEVKKRVPKRGIMGRESFARVSGRHYPQAVVEFPDISSHRSERPISTEESPVTII